MARKTRFEKRMEKIPKEIEGIKLKEKTRKAFDLCDRGMEPKLALSVVNNGQPVTPTAVSLFKRKYEKYSLTTKKMQKLAHKAVQETLEMKEVNGVLPTVSNRISAAQMVVDRVDPIVKVNENHNVNVDLHPVDLSKYLKRNPETENEQVIDC